MRSSAFVIAAALLGALLPTGCATYSEQPALAFRDFDYSGPDGKAWPARDVELPEIQRMYRMATVPSVHVVELNPEGAPTLVFVHGLGSYLKFWRYNLDHFARAGYRVVALDQIGYGKSSKPASFPYTMEAMADVVKAVIERLELGAPVVVGHSMGGQTALSLAIRYPEAISGLVLASPAGLEKFTAREQQWFRDAVRSVFIRSSDEDAIWGAVRYANFYRWSDDYDWLVEERVRAAGNESFPAYAYANVRSIQGLAANDFVRGNLSRVAAPTVIIHGDRDRLIPSPFMHGGFTRDVMAYGASEIPGATLITLEGCGHTVQIDCHDAFNAAAGEWLKSHLDPGHPPAPETPAAPAEAPAAAPGE